MEATTPNTRVRMNVKQSAKGAMQLDCTAEAPTVQQAGELLEGALQEARARIEKAGYQLTEA